MKRAIVVGLGVASLAFACTEKGRAVVLVNLTATPDVMGVEEVQVHAVRPSNGQSIHHAEGGPPDVMLGIYIPKTYRGDVSIQACGFTAAHELIAASTPVRVTMIDPGATIGPIYVELRADPTASPVCGAPSGGSAGGGGADGTSGSGGTGGSAGSAGTDGSAGDTGTGGTGGSGG